MLLDYGVVLGGVGDVVDLAVEGLVEVDCAGFGGGRERGVAGGDFAAVEGHSSGDFTLGFVQPDVHFDVEIVFVGQEAGFEVWWGGQFGAGDVDVAAGVRVDGEAADGEVLFIRAECGNEVGVVGENGYGGDHAEGLVGGVGEVVVPGGFKGRS